MNRLGLMIVGVAALVGWGQVWERFSNPTVNLQLRHPPGLGLNIKRMAFGPSSGPCADEIVDRLSARLVSGGIEVADRENLRVVLEEQKFGNSGAVDSATAAELGKLLGPMALVFLKVGRCNTQGRRNYTDTKVREGVIRTHRAIVELNIRGTLQTVDLNTGRIFAAQDLIVTESLTNSSQEGLPEFPSQDQVKDAAIAKLTEQASRVFLPWSESRRLVFFDDKDCNLNRAFALLRAGDLNAVVTQSEENVTSCATWPKVKPSTQAHAQYNAGLAYLLLRDHEKAMSHLRAAAALKDSGIVNETIAEVTRSANLEARMRQVVDKTEQFESSRRARAEAAQTGRAGGATSSETARSADRNAASSTPQPRSSAKESPEERLSKLDALFKKGLITKTEYDAKRLEILKEI